MPLLYDPPNLSDRAILEFKDRIAAGEITAPSWMNRSSHRLLNWFQRQPNRWQQQGAAEPDFQSTLDHPRTLRFRQSCRGVVTHPTSSSPWGEWIVELARFAVPRGCVGFVNSWEQYLANGQQVYTSFQGAGNPFIAGSDFQWVFRLDRYDGTIAPWIDSIVPIPWPGQAFPDLPVERDLWFAADRGRAPFRWIVPGGYQLRLFFEQTAPSDSVRFSVASKLRGGIQAELAPNTRENLRSLW